MLLFAGGLAALMSGSFLPRDRQGVSRAVAVTALVASLRPPQVVTKRPCEQGLLFASYRRECVEVVID